jgi:hypothetical protein
MDDDLALDNDAVQALINAYVACKLAMDALPHLPDDVRAAVEEPVTALCRVVGPEVERLRPGSDAPSST